MSHIGLVTPWYAGHANPMITLGNELQRRGHQVTMFSMLDAQASSLRNNIDFVPLGEKEFPLGTSDRFTETQGRLTGFPAIRYIIKDLYRMAEVHARELPDALTSRGVDALVIDQIQPMGTVVAHKLDLPYVTLCSLLPLNTDVSVPPFMMPWPYSESTQARIQNTIGYKVQELVERPLTVLTNKQRVTWGMKPTTVDGTFSPLAQITQTPAFLDFPRKNAPACFHNTAPLVDFEQSDPIPFPWEKLDGRPLIYASMGTLQNRLPGIFHNIAASCVGLDAQLVISLGQRGAQIPPDLPGNPIVGDYVPQLDLLKRASLLIGHGGQNTMLQALALGVPMVLMPAATDQPGVCARAKRIGVAEFIPARKVTAAKLRALVEKVLTEPSYRENARKYHSSLKDLNGAQRSADIVEQAFSTRRPVLREAVAV